MTSPLPGGRSLPDAAPQELPRAFRVHPVTLSFASPAQERDFMAGYQRVSRGLWRLCHVLALLLYSVYVVVHALTVPEHRDAFLFIGFGAVVPMFVAGLALSWSPWYQRQWQLANVVYVLVTGAGALAMSMLAGEAHQFFTLTGLLFCFLFGYALIRLRFILASLAGGVLTAAFLYLSPELLRQSSSIYWLGVTYVVGFNVLGMLIASITVKPFETPAV